MTHILLAALLTLSIALDAGAQSPGGTGVLLLAHGGAKQWNAHVTELAEAIDREQPVEIAFGMASRASIQAAVDRLVARKVTNIVAVPLFVSSWSSVITSTEYLLGVRPEAPSELAIFAKMHSHGAAAGGVREGQAADPTSPIASPVPIRMTSALNRHRLVGQILTDRARSISTNPDREAVVLVAHGPVPDEDNRKWLEDMAVLARQVESAAPFAAVRYLTVRDDAGPAMRDEATRQLRGLVEEELAQGRRVLIVPHLLSFGGIEKGVQKRLEGLTYTMTRQALMPDARLREWVLSQAASAR
jgi:sirohydrochlorin ferrochelatase